MKTPRVRQHNPVSAAGDHRPVGRSHLDRCALNHGASLFAQPTPKRAPTLLVAGRRHTKGRAVVERRMEANGTHETLGQLARSCDATVVAASVTK